MFFRSKNSKKKYTICEDCELSNLCIIDKRVNCMISSNCNSKKKASCTPIGMFLGIISMLFGTVLLFPYHTFDNNELYTAMYKVSTEEKWGIVCFLLGLFQIYITNTPKRKNLKIISLSLQTFLWTFIGTMFLINDLILGHSLNVAFTTYLSLAGLSLYTAYKM